LCTPINFTRLFLQILKADFVDLKSVSPDLYLERKLVVFISANDLTGTQLGCTLTFFFIDHIAAETHPKQYGTGSSSRKHLSSLRVKAPRQ